MKKGVFSRRGCGWEKERESPWVKEKKEEEERARGLRERERESAEVFRLK